MAGASNLGVLLGLSRVLVPLHVVVLVVILRGGAMRLGRALMMIGHFYVCAWLGIWISRCPGNSRSLS